MTTEGIMDEPPVVFSLPVSLIPLFQNSELLLYGKNFGL
jgi:hypothetical protein